MSVFCLRMLLVEKAYYIYLVICSDESLYCGYTTNLKKRIKAHNEGKGAKYTKSRRPVTLVYHEVLATKTEALRREYEIKRYSRQAKLKLIEKGKDNE